MTFQHKLSAASGPNLQACAFLGLRGDARYDLRPDTMESWVVIVDGNSVTGALTVPGRMSGVWRSPTGTIFAGSLAGMVYEITGGEDGRPHDIKKHPLQSTCAGIWGLNDDLVFAWGEYDVHNRMYLRQGGTWREIPSPGFVNGMHGIRHDLIIAVGANGLVARWDAGRWLPYPTPEPAMLSSVWVASEDEMYATGPRGHMLRGSIHGWADYLLAPWPLYGVAKYGADVFVAAGREGGLRKLDTGLLVAHRPKVRAERLDARQSLLVSTPTAILATNDGEEFNGLTVEGFEKMVASYRPLWEVFPS
jgi:hypothetical protein